MIKNRLSRLIGDKRLSMAEVARRSGLHVNTIFKIYHNKTLQIEFEVMDKLCIALECESLQELFEFVKE